MGTHRLEIPAEMGGGWADIREKLSWARAQRISGGGVRVSPKEGADLSAMTSRDVVMAFDKLAEGMAKLEAYVVRWSLTDEAGSPIPVTPEGFQHEDLDPEVTDWLLDQADAYYAARRLTKRRALEAPPGDPPGGATEGVPGGA